MPAYFEMSLQFLRKDLGPDFIANFDAHLERSGLRFSSGCWEDAGLSQAEIAAWNQKKLDSDFVLGYTTHCSNDYKQTLYSFGGYEEVRGYWMNQYPAEGAFTYLIIIPESEVLEEGISIFRPKAAAELTELAKGLWQFPLVRAIQTGLEMADPPLSLAELRRGLPPDLSPLAVVERDCHPCDDGSQVIELTQGRPGLLLLDNEELSGPVIEVSFGGPLRLEERGGR